MYACLPNRIQRYHAHGPAKDTIPKAEQKTRQLFLPQQTFFFDEIGLEYAGIRLVPNGPHLIGRVAGCRARSLGHVQG
jgi:hypothetical protein